MNVLFAHIHGIIWRVGEGGGGSFEIGFQRSRGWKKDRRRWLDGQGVRSLENWTIFMDVVVVLSLKWLSSAHSIFLGLAR